MSKIAIFVEGYTEEALVERLLIELVGADNVQIEIQRQYGGVLNTVAIRTLSGAESKFVLLVNCCGDGAVLSQIRDQYQSLERAGYQCILGLRDVFPEPAQSVPNLIAGVNRMLPSGSVPVSMLFAIREIESWFLQESTHYARIDAGLTPGLVASLGFDPFSVASNAETIPGPAQHLHRIYRLVGKAYRKSRKQRGRTVAALSPEELYFSVRGRLSSLNQFLTAIEAALYPV